MRFITPIYLVSCDESVDDAGIVTSSPIERKVFADKVSIGQSEFYQAHRSGLKPQLKFKVRSIEYSGEEKLRYENCIYAILRTYDNQSGIVELTCSKDDANGST